MSDSDDTPDDNGWNGDRRPTRLTVDSIRTRLDSIADAQRGFKRDLDKLREVVAKDVENGAERTYLIRSLQDRVNDLYARFVTVEQRYINKDEHEKALAPFKKWGSWIAMLVIGGVVTAVMALVLGKGNVH